MARLRDDLSPEELAQMGAMFKRWRTDARQTRGQLVSRLRQVGDFMQEYGSPTEAKLLHLVGEVEDGKQRADRHLLAAWAGVCGVDISALLKKVPAPVPVPRDSGERREVSFPKRHGLSAPTENRPVQGSTDGANTVVGQDVAFADVDPNDPFGGTY